MSGSGDLLQQHLISWVSDILDSPPPGRVAVRPLPRVPGGPSLLEGGLLRLLGLLNILKKEKYLDTFLLWIQKCIGEGEFIFCWTKMSSHLDCVPEDGDVLHPHADPGLRPLTWLASLSAHTPGCQPVTPDLPRVSTVFTSHNYILFFSINPQFTARQNIPKRLLYLWQLAI